MNANFLHHLAKNGKFPPEPSVGNVEQYQRVVAKALRRARQGHLLMCCYTTDIEGKDYNIEGMLISNGFFVIRRPGKKVVIGW